VVKLIGRSVLKKLGTAYLIRDSKSTRKNTFEELKISIERFPQA